MIKKLFITLLLLLLPWSTVVWAGVVTQANMRLSLIDGNAFVDFSLADVLTDHLNAKVTITDGAAKVLIGYIKSAGTGETYTEKIVNGTMEADSNWANYGLEGADTQTRSDVQKHAGSYSRCISVDTWTEGAQSDLFAVVTGTLYKVSGWHWVTSGSTRIVKYQSRLPFDSDTISGGASWSEYAGYWIAITTGNEAALLLSRSSSTANLFYWDDVSIKSVDTVSATGVRITSTSGGATYNWTSMDVGFNYNDTSYTYEVETDPVTYYVSNDGDDTNAGTEIAPFEHIPGGTGCSDNCSTAAAALAPGDSILLNKDDTWSSTTVTIPVGGTEGNPITLSSYGTGAEPIISAAANSYAIAVTAADRGYWTIDGIDLRSTGSPGGLDFSTAVYFNYWPSEMGPVPGWTFQNCLSNASLFVCGPNLTVKDCIFDGEDSADNIRGAIVVRGPNADDTLIEGNTISRHAGKGMWLYNGIDDAIVRYNTVHDIGMYHDEVHEWYESAGISDDGAATKSTGFKIYNNLVYDTQLQGITLENSFGSEVYDNLIYDTLVSGISIIYYDDDWEDPAYSSVYNNVIHDTRLGIVMWDGSYLTFANNTIYNGVGEDTSAFRIYSDNTYVNHITLTNNIFAGPWDYPLWCYTGDIWTQFDYNQMTPNGSGDIWHVAAVTDRNLAETQALSLMEHGFTDDPLFTNAAGDDFTLTSLSPAIGAGVDLGNGLLYGLDPTSTWPDNVKPLDQDDYEDWEIGAYVYIEAGPTGGPGTIAGGGSGTIAGGGSGTIIGTTPE